MRLLTLRLFSCFVFSAVISLQAATDYDNSNFDSYDTNDMANDFGDEIPDLDPSEMTLRIPADTIATTVLQHIKNPLWKNTTAPVGRDILYLLPQKITAIEYGGISAKFFFNMTNRMKMTVDDMLTLSDIKTADLKNLITSMIPDGSSPEVFEQFIPLFQKITIQERKAGVMFQGGFVKGPFTLQAATSLQLGERNFWLSTYDQAVIKELFPDDSESDHKELYKIAAGLGDTRVKFGLNTLNMTSFQNDLGFSFILPTSRLTQSEKVNLGLVQIVLNEASNQDGLKNEAIRSLKAVRDYLLNPRLGNNGHFGVGCYAEQKIGLFHDFMQLWIGASYDLYLANEEERLYMFKKTLQPSDMAGMQQAFDPADIASNNQKVTNYIRQYILPSSFKVTVQPGDVTNLVTALTVDWNKRWRSTWGYDFYAQRQTLIRHIHNTSIDINTLRVDDELTSDREKESVYAYQHKVFSETQYRLKTKRNDLGVGFGSDMTVSSKRIGEDWTVYLKFAASF